MARPIFDPAALPIVSVSTDEALAPSKLSADWLRRCFAKPAAWEPEIRVEHNLPNVQGTPTPAAVLVPLVMREQGLTLLLTQRTAHLYDHAGQISFPGGRVDATDRSPTDTALRETEEEIGLHRSHVEIIGQLPDYMTGTGFHVTPLVGLVRAPFDLKLDDFEVAEAFEVPLPFLMNPAHHQQRRIQLGEGTAERLRTFYTMPYQQYFIWGATAAMIRNLYCFLAAQDDLQDGVK